MNMDRRLFKKKCIIGVVAAVVLRTAIVPVLHAADMKPEEIVARHLDSIGTAEVRASAKSRIVQGTSHYKIGWEQAASFRAQVLWSRRDANRS